MYRRRIRARAGQLLARVILQERQMRVPARLKTDRAAITTVIFKVTGMLMTMVMAAMVVTIVVLVTAMFAESKP